MSLTGLSSAEFARAMGVHPSQPTRWIKLGMPVNADGSIPAGEAAEWVRLNVRDYRRARHSIAARQMQAAEESERETALNDFARLPLTVLAHQMPNLAAQLALSAGADITTAKKLYRLMQTGVAECVNEVATEWCGIGHGERGPWKTVGETFKPDWAALEDQSGRKGRQ